MVLNILKPLVYDATNLGMQKAHSVKLQSLIW